jgi:iron(III) transport system substrate-binding protein
VKRTAEVRLLAYSSFEEYELTDYLSALAKDVPSIAIDLVRMPTAELKARLLVERESPKFDLILGWAASAMFDPAILEQLEPHAAPNSRTLPPSHVDAQGRWFAPTGFSIGFCIHDEYLHAHNLPRPRSWEDLLDPRLKGHITMPSPQSSGAAFLILCTLLQKQGKNDGWAYLEALHAQIADYGRSAWHPVAAVGKGHCGVAISVVIAGARQIQLGMPVSLVLPEDGSGYELEVFAAGRTSRFKPEARQVLEWLVSPRALSIYKSYRKVIFLPQADDILDDSNMFPIDMTWATKERSAILSHWETIMRLA